jgi:hypothetical protein
VCVIVIFLKDRIKAICNDRFWSHFFDEFGLEGLEAPWLVAEIRLNPNTHSVFVMLFLSVLHGFFKYKLAFSIPTKISENSKLFPNKHL